MKRLQILIDEDLDEMLAEMAARSRTSKAELIRRFVRRALEPMPPLEDDPLMALVGSASFEPADIDDVVYGK